MGLAVFGAIAGIVQQSFGGRLFWVLVGVIAYAYFYYFQRDAHAEIYENGFVISRGSKTTRARWEDIANAEHWVKRTKLYFVLTVSKSHYYIITLRNGEPV